MKKFIVLFCLFGAISLRGQCKIESGVRKDGLSFKHTENELLYSTQSYTLFSAAFHDGQRYYLKVVLRPMKLKKVKKDHIELYLKNDEKCSLDFYDSFQVKKDTSIQTLFKITDELLKKLTEQDVKSISISTDSGRKQYNLIQHHGLIREQLNCLVTEISRK